jgi:hypothetical protein
MPESFEEAFDSFEECVSTLEQNDGVDDPEALCGWLQEHGFEAISTENPDQILADLSVEYVSVVDEPAQSSEWLLAKDEDGPETLDDLTEWSAPYLVRNLGDDGETGEAERKVWAAVLVPGESDKQGDLVPDHEIERTAHEYLRDYRKVDADHDLLDGAGVPIESYIIRNGPEEFETPDGSTVEYPEGTWIMGVQVGPDEWNRIQSGDLSGFSIYGGANPVQADDLLTERQTEAILSMNTGVTSKQTGGEDAAVVLSVIDEYVSSGASSDATVAALAEWVADDAPEEVIEGVNIVSASASTIPGGEPTTDLLTEIRDDVQETRKSVESQADRMNDVEDRLDALEKEEGDDSGESDGEEESAVDAGEEKAVRKFGFVPAEKREQPASERINLSYEGLSSE